MDFQFEGFSIECLIAHKVHVRDANKERVAPFLSNKVMALDVDSKKALQKRLSEALGRRSRGVEMSIVQTQADSFFQVAASLLAATDANFITGSHPLAESLTTAQLSASNAPEGVLLVIKGRVGEGQNRFIAVVKGETQDGFAAKESEDQVLMSYLKDLLLTPSQRLYKIGILVEVSANPVDAAGLRAASDFRGFLFDHLMTATETRHAASYFYNAFLGMSIQHSSKELTKNYFEWTKGYINSSAIEADGKRELIEALRVDLRSQSGTVR